MTPIIRCLSFALFLAVIAIASSPKTAVADPQSGMLQFVKHHHDDDDDDFDQHKGWWKHHDADDWKHYRHGHYRGDDARCGQILDRIAFNRAKVREIAPTGRHRKAMQWYKDDTVNAEKDLDRCRHGG